MNYTIKLFIIFASLFFKNCFAYYQTTHRFLGSRLANSLKTLGLDNVIGNVEKLVPLSKFGDESTWADKIKRNQEYSWSAKLHYIDINQCNSNQTRVDLDKYCDNNCIYTGILNMTNSLRDTNFTDQKTSTDNLKFLLHFLQDLHQPLHLNGWSRGVILGK